MSDTELSRNIVLNKSDVETAQFLKKALDCKTDSEVVSESLNVTMHVVRVIREGGTVVLHEKNGMSNQMVVKT